MNICNKPMSLSPVVVMLALLATACTSPSAVSPPAVISTAMAPAAASPIPPPALYPDWAGQWERIGSLNWPPEGYEKAGPAPLTAEYQAVYENNLALRKDGILAGDPPATCLPPGMPRMMKMSFPMEIIITPKLTYIYADWESQIRRVYTDGRNWPDYILPEFNGYSIGSWHDENNDGVYDMLAIETRGIKGPRSIDSTGVVLHENNATVVFEEIRQFDASTLENTITTIDDAFTQPWTIKQQYNHVTDNIIWVEYVCAEGNRHIKLGDEWYFLNDEAGILEPTREGQPALVPQSQ
jgi:hypothetical protein